MEYIKQFFVDFIGILNDMSPYLLLGFLFAGILKVFVPQDSIDKHLGQRTFKSVLYAALMGVPLPLCSCGVIPTGVSFYKNGMSKGATVSFLISTPQTGVDSIMVTYSLLGLPFAVIRPIVALVSGVFGGVVTNKFDTEKHQPKVSLVGLNDTIAAEDTCTSCETPDKKHSKLYEMFKYAFVDFLQDIAKWLLIGLVLAALISVLVPDNFFEYFRGNPLLEMLMILVVSIPLYVCATASVPVAASLMLKGLSPGAALVFLMAGPATNAATITVLKNSLGNRTLWSYLVSIIVSAMAFGLLINHLLPQSWFDVSQMTHMSAHMHHGLPAYVQWSSSIILLSLMINAFIRKKLSKPPQSNQMKNHKTFVVNGMNCNHCKNSVEKTVNALPFITNAQVNLEQHLLHVEGDNIDVSVLQKEIESLGFEYAGEKSDSQ
ncbi:MAG: heavy metal-associated domain-containing protein [Flavobacteriia bacterium]|nr:MAG: heavy metal-associated domain-containing protein [Flavobacteriia bacterium]